MADGKTHSLITIGTGFGFVGASLLHFLEPVQIAVMSLGCVLQLFYSADADVDQGSISDFYIRKLFGTDFFYDIWLKPYRKSVKHRSFWSHFPVVGTFFRLIYVIFPFIIFFIKDQPTKSRTFILDLIFAQLVGIGILSLLIFLDKWVDLWYWIVPLILAMVFADMLHYLLDML